MAGTHASELVREITSEHKHAARLSILASDYLRKAVPLLGSRASAQASVEAARCPTTDLRTLTRMLCAQKS